MWQSPKYFEKGRGLPRQCAHWLAMTDNYLLQRLQSPLADVGAAVGTFKLNTITDWMILGRFHTSEHPHLRHGNHA